MLLSGRELELRLAHAEDSGARAGATDLDLAGFVARTEHGRALVATDPGFADEIPLAARRDAFAVVPEGSGGVIVR